MTTDLDKRKKELEKELVDLGKGEKIKELEIKIAEKKRKNTFFGKLFDKLK